MSLKARNSPRELFMQEPPEGSGPLYRNLIHPRRPVEVAANQEDVAVISKGLQSGERIVVEGQYRLIDGAKVKIGAPAQQQAELGGQAAQ